MDITLEISKIIEATDWMMKYFRNHSEEFTIDFFVFFHMEQNPMVFISRVTHRISHELVKILRTGVINTIADMSALAVICILRGFIKLLTRMPKLAKLFTF